MFYLHNLYIIKNYVITTLTTPWPFATLFYWPDMFVVKDGQINAHELIQPHQVTTLQIQLIMDNWCWLVADGHMEDTATLSIWRLRVVSVGF